MHIVKKFVGHEQEIVKFILGGELIFSLGEKGEFVMFN